MLPNTPATNPTAVTPRMNNNLLILTILILISARLGVLPNVGMCCPLPVVSSVRVLVRMAIIRLFLGH